MSKNTRNRILLTAVAALLLVTLTIGGTIAWLTATSSEVKNTFTPSTLDVTLTETWNTDTDDDDEDDSWTAQMVPGATIDKDPTVTYTSDVPAWLFVQVTESENFSNFMTYAIAEGWNALDGVEGVYYRAVLADDAEGAETSFAVLANDQVTVNTTVTKELMATLYTTSEDGTVIVDEEAVPTLSFQAYIIQSENLVDGTGKALTEDDIATIWDLASGN